MDTQDLNLSAIRTIRVLRPLRAINRIPSKYKMISYRRETALQGALVLAKSGRLELGDNILWTL